MRRFGTRWQSAVTVCQRDWQFVRQLISRAVCQPRPAAARGASAGHCRAAPPFLLIGRLSSISVTIGAINLHFFAGQC